MDTISSTEFRKRFARLTKPTIVTVNGHVIGTWFPGSVIDAAVMKGAMIGAETATRQIVKSGAENIVAAIRANRPQTFTPVPKPSQKKGK